jgi:hypothetical protein
MSYKTPEIRRMEGKPEYMIKVVDEGESCNVLIVLPRDPEKMIRLVEGVAKATVSASRVLSEAGYRCGHIGCIFNEIFGDAMAELRDHFPEEFARAKEQALKQRLAQILMDKGRDDEPVH